MSSVHQDSKSTNYNKENILIALLIAKGTVIKKEIVSILDIPYEELPDIIKEIEKNVAHLPVEIKQTDTIISLHIKKDILNIIKPYLDESYRKRLSDNALEVLAIVAYCQPIKKSEIDRIRGVDSESSLETLRKLKLIKGTPLKEPGMPLIFTTTELFLKSFGIASLTELPALEGIEKIRRILQERIPE